MDDLNHSKQIQDAVTALTKGQLVVFPTETVYGLGADAFNIEAIKKLYQLKGRPADHPSIIHLADPKDVLVWAKHVPEYAWKLAQLFWPGPLTMVFQKTETVPYAVTGGQETVALRIPSHPMALMLIKAFGGGIAAPSANKFGRISPTTVQHVKDDLGEEVTVILDGGPCTVGIESTIVDCTGESPKVLRPGMITDEFLAAALEMPIPMSLKATDISSIKVPGLLPIHYAPQKPLHLVSQNDLTSVVQNIDTSLAYAVLAHHPLDHLPSNWHMRMAPQDPVSYAAHLYEYLRELDQLPVEAILVEEISPEGLWFAIWDRLQRASSPLSEPRGVSHD